MFTHHGIQYFTPEEVMVRALNCNPQNPSMFQSLFISLPVADTRGVPSKQSNHDLALALAVVGYTLDAIRPLRTKQQKRYQLVKWWKRSMAHGLAVPIVIQK